MFVITGNVNTMANIEHIKPNNNYIYGFWINQKAVNDWLLYNNRELITISELYVLCYIISVWNNPNGLIHEVKDSKKYIYLNDKVITDNLIFLKIEKRQLKNYISKFVKIQLLKVYIKNNSERFINVDSKLIELYFKDAK